MNLPTNRMARVEKQFWSVSSVCRLALAHGLLIGHACATTGGWQSGATGDWDSVYNIGNYGMIDGYGTAYYNNSATNAYGPANGYTTAAGGESSYWLNTGPNGYTTSGTDPSGNGQSTNFTTCRWPEPRLVFDKSCLRDLEGWRHV